METLITSSPEKEIAKKGIQCDMVNCGTLGVKKALESENQSEIVGDDMKIVCGDEKVNSSSTVLINLQDDSENTIDDDNAKEKARAEKTVFGEEECKKENDEGAIEIKKRKRGRKKKVPESSEGIKDKLPKKVKDEVKDEVKVTGRLLRSRTMTSGGAKVDERRLNENVVGFKRQMEADCFDQTEFLKEVNESSQVDRRPQKKQKRRGRPPKLLGDACLRKIKDVAFDQNEIQKQVNERSQLAGRPHKKQKRRGRPPKKQGETGLKRKMKDDCFDQVDPQEEVNEHNQLTGRQQQKTQTKNHKDKMIKELKGRGKSPKVQVESLSTNTENPSNNLLKAKDVKEGPKIQHVQNKDQESETTGVSKQMVKLSEESNDHNTVEETVKVDKDRRKKQQLLRDQIVSMIIKAGWTIEYRPRQGREYLDAVYVDQIGRTHWSITKAYFCLKKKIEKGDADAKEISAFTTIPDEEMSILSRSVSKIRSDKNTKKNKRGKNISQAAIVISEDAPLMKPPNKKGKAGKMRKEIYNKLSNVKLKKVKSRHEHGVSAESAVGRQSKVSKKGRQNRKPCLIARSSSKGLGQDNDDPAMYTVKRNIFSWMIDSGVMRPGGKLLYKEGRRRNRFLEGQVMCDGIHCSCCNEVMDLSNFVSHGGEKLDHALENIYYQSGPSLLMCLLESWRKEVRVTNIRFNDVDVKGEDPHDDTCNTCGDGGDLICCDGCPSTFHQSCLDIQKFPSGDWHCLYCCCKFCGLVASDDSHHVPNFELITCCLCEEKFHRLCLQEEAINVGFSSLSFCGRKCQELYEQLQTYIGVKFKLQEGYSWTLLKCYDHSQHLDDPMKVECNSKLAVAFSVMDECFVPIMDERSGVNKIHNVVYNCGSNFRRLDYSGFLTAVLEKDGEFISAASIRIHGNRLAEMPFIGTRNMYRRQGMCRRLLDAIEGALCSIGVEELVIPAIPELYKTWTKVFGFEPLDKNLRQAMKGMSLVVFPFTDMLHKPLVNNQFADKNLTLETVSGGKSVEVITVDNDNNTLSSEQTLATHLESETPFLPSDKEHKSVALVNNDITEVKLSHLTSKVVPKNSFDLNLQPATTDTDIQLIDDESISRDPRLCKNPFELSDSMTQADNTPTQSLVLV